MSEDPIICTCNNVSRSTILKTIKEKGLKTEDEGYDATDAGMVCGSCCVDIQEIMEENL